MHNQCRRFWICYVCRLLCLAWEDTCVESFLRLSFNLTNPTAFQDLCNISLGKVSFLRLLFVYIYRMAVKTAILLWNNTYSSVKYNWTRAYSFAQIDIPRGFIIQSGTLPIG